MRNRLLSAVLLLAFLVSLLLAPLTAQANEKGKKNTTIGLGAGSAALFLTHHTLPGILVGGAAVYSYSQYAREHNHNARARAYDKGWRAGRASR